MRLPLAFTVLLLASAQALADEMAAPDDLSYWADWADGEQKVSAETEGCVGAGGAGAVLSAALSPCRRSCRCHWSTFCRGWQGDPGPSSSLASWASGMRVSGAGHPCMLCQHPSALLRGPLPFSHLTFFSGLFLLLVQV